MELISGIRRIEKNLSEVSTLLDSLNDNNFQVKIDRINFLYKDIVRQKELLKLNYSTEELRKYDKILIEYVKVIEKKFDNIIAEKNERSIYLKKELFLINNKKKLINYK